MSSQADPPSTSQISALEAKVLKLQATLLEQQVKDKQSDAGARKNWMLDALPKTSAAFLTLSLGAFAFQGYLGHRWEANAADREFAFKIMQTQLSTNQRPFQMSQKLLYFKCVGFLDALPQADNLNTIIVNGFDGIQNQDQYVDAKGNPICTNLKPIQLSSAHAVQTKFGTIDLVTEEVATLFAAIATSVSKNNPNFGSNNLTCSGEISEISVGELMSCQEAHIESGSGTATAGKFAFTQALLKEMVGKGWVSENETFTETLQTELALHLINDMGLARVVDGTLSVEQMAERLAWEWGAIAGSDGETKYGGKPKISYSEVVAAISSVIPK